MKVNVKSLPNGYSVVNGKIVNTMAEGGATSALPASGYDDTQSDGISGRIASSLPSIPRDQANLEAEKGETVLTDMNNDGNFELYNIGGNRHHSGGTPLNLPPQSFIYSDTSKMKLDKYELSEMGITSKKKLTPAKVSKGYELNKFIGILDDEHSDHITRDTAEYMLSKNKRSLSQLAFLQEAKKQFEDGVPLASYPYLTEKGINPLQFSQQVEQISAQEAEQKMMMQLPFEQRAQIMMAKEQQAQQQAMMQQQQMMAQQQQQMGAPQGMAQQQQMAPPQGMMPPQAPMQQPMVMARRGGQMSNLYKAQFGIGTDSIPFMSPPAAVRDNTYMAPPIIPIDNGSQSEFFEEEVILPLNLQPEVILANYINETNQNMENYQSQINNSLNDFDARWNPNNSPYAAAMNSSQQYNPEMVDFWENHIKMGGTPPNTPSVEYTEAYARVYPNQLPPVNNEDDTDDKTNTTYINIDNDNKNNDDRYVKHGNITFAKGTNPNSLGSGDIPSGFDAAGLPLNYNDTDNPYYVGAQWAARDGGSLPSYQFRGELGNYDNVINFGNKTSPDAVLSNRNFSTDENIGYHWGMGMDDANLQKYTGTNLGFNPSAFGAMNKSMMNKTFLDRTNSLLNLDFTAGSNVSNDDWRAYTEGRAGIGWGIGNKPGDWIVDRPDGTTYNTGITTNNQLHYLNPYLSGVAGLDFNVGENESIGLQGSLNTALSPYGRGLGARLNFNKGDWGVNVGTEDITGSPQTTFGASYTFRDGGSLPSFRKGGQGIEYPKGSGTFYSKKDMKKLSKSTDPNQQALYAEIMNGGPIKPKVNPSDVNKQVINTEGTSSSESFTGGADAWGAEYLADTPRAEAYRAKRYEAYKERRLSEGKDVLEPQEYHNAYAQFQEQNYWLEQNLTQEERNTPDWDDGTNDKYHASLEGSGMSPLTDEYIGHVQSGYIGGQALQLTGDEYTQFMQSGVDDQTVFGLSISPEDGKFGNTTNDQREEMLFAEETPGVPCSNAEELSTLCSEAGGTWTPYNAEDPENSCKCSEKIIPPPPVKPPETPDADFWLQDRMGITNAMDNKFSLKKYYPWAPEYNLMQIDPVFKDPTREIAAIGEQAVIAADTASTFSGPQRAAAVQAKAQGVAGKQIADAINKVQSDNVTIANTNNVKNKELEYKTQVLNNNEQKQLYDNTMLTEQNYDNALREANAQITKQLQNAYTNRANTSNLNSIYPNFNIDPTTGGLIDITNPKAFYSDPNYVSPQTSIDNYLIERKKLEDSGNFTTEQINEMFPYKSTATKKGKTSSQQNADVITSGYQTDGTATSKFGRETRRKNLLKKGRALRNWFSPLRGY